MRPDALTLVDHWLRCVISTLPLTGLSGCGQPSPDSIGQATPNTPPNATTATTRNDSANAGVRQPVPPSAPERRTTDARPQSQKAQEAARPAPTIPDPTAAARQQWFAEARDHSDGTVRRQALELWAEQPSRDLNPLTYALVDEDDSVRTRAQELYEQQLAREATAAQQAE